MLSVPTEMTVPFNNLFQLVAAVNNFLRVIYIFDR